MSRPRPWPRPWPGRGETAEMRGEAGRRREEAGGEHVGLGGAPPAVGVASDVQVAPARVGSCGSRSIRGGGGGGGASGRLAGGARQGQGGSAGRQAVHSTGVGGRRCSDGLVLARPSRLRLQPGHADDSLARARRPTRGDAQTALRNVSLGRRLDVVERRAELRCRAEQAPAALWNHGVPIRGRVYRHLSTRPATRAGGEPPGRIGSCHAKRRTTL